MKPKLKICGITTLEDARFCAAAGVDFLGFVMYEESPRCVDPNLARDIREWVVGPLSVGVFVDEDPATVNALAQQIGFDLVQLHGTETPDDCRLIDRPVIKAIGVPPDGTADELSAEVDRFSSVADYLMFDTRLNGRSGGTGMTFDWTLLADAARRHRVFLAGGIHAGNALQAVEAVHPFALDVSSGVEERPGVKDFDRISQLVETLGRSRRQA